MASERKCVRFTLEARCNGCCMKGGQNKRGNNTVAHGSCSFMMWFMSAHRKELDFESVLDESRTISLCPEMLMKVLYAHTRTVSVMKF